MSEIDVSISYQGTEEGAAQMATLVDNLEAASVAQMSVAETATRMGQKQKESATRAVAASRKQKQLTDALTSQVAGFGALGSAIGQVGTVMGRLDPKLSRLGQALGQAGQSVSAVATALAAPTPGSIVTAVVSVTATLVDGITAIQAYADGTRDASSDLDDMASAADHAQVSINNLAQSMARQRRQANIAFGEATEGAIGAELSDVTSARIQQEANDARLAQNVQRLRIGRQERISEREGTGVSPERASALDARLADEGRILDILEAEQAASAQRTGEMRVREFELASLQMVEVQRDTSAAMEEAEERSADRSSGGARDTSERDRLRQAARDAAALLRIEAEGQAFLDALEAQRQEQMQSAFQDELAFVNAITEAKRTAREEELALALEAMEKEKEARRNAMDERRAEMAEVASNLTRVTTAITGAFQSAIEGQQTLEEALISATKMILKSFGDEMVARGIGAILESISMLPSPLAAPKAAGGVAMVAFGVGLGAAGAAIPSPGGGAAAPREDAPSGESDGPREVNIVFGNPVLTAQTTAQLSRTIRKGIAGDRTLPAGF